MKQNESWKGVSTEVSKFLAVGHDGAYQEHLIELINRAMAAQLQRDIAIVRGVKCELGAPQARWVCQDVLEALWHKDSASSCPRCGTVVSKEFMPDGRVIIAECCVSELDRERALRRTYGKW